MYNEIELSFAELERVQSEVLTWHTNNRNKLVSQTLSNEITYQCVIDDDGIVHVFGRYSSQNIHEGVGKFYVNNDTEELSSLAKELQAGPRNNGFDSGLSQNRRNQRRDDSNDNFSISSEGQRGRARRSKDFAHANRKPKEYKFNDDGTAEVTYDEGIVHVYNAELSTNIHERKNKYDNTDRERPDRFIEKLRAGQRYNGGDFDTGENGQKPSEINRDDNLSLRRGKRGRRAGYSKNATYDNRKPKEYKFNEDGTAEVTYDDGTTTKFSKRNPSKEINIDDYTLDELVNLPDDKFSQLYEALGLDVFFSDDESWEDLNIDDISEELNIEPEKVEIHL